jgi:hypothetical protein
MKTTLVLDDALVERVRQRARERGVSMSSIVEEAIFKLLSEQPPAHRAEPHPLPRYRLGEFLVDIADRDALYDTMDGL